MRVRAFIFPIPKRILDRKMRYWRAAVLLAGTLLICCSSFHSEKAMGTDMNKQNEQIQMLSADLMPFVSDPTISMVVVQIVGLNLKKQQGTDLELEVGTVVVAVKDIIYSKVLTKGVTIEVPVNRIADLQIRSKNGINQWNNLALINGDLLLLACRPTSSPKVYAGLGATSIDSTTNHEVVAIRKCYVIEHLKSSQEKRRTLTEEALTSEEPILYSYALDLVGRRSAFGRDAGVDMVSRAILSDKTKSDPKLDLGFDFTDTYFFDPERKSDPANHTVVATLAKQMVSESDPERRLRWISLLSSCVLGEFSAKSKDDEAARIALVRTIQTPSPKQVVDALNEVFTQAEDADKERITDLKKVWHRAWGSKTK